MFYVTLDLSREPGNFTESKQYPVIQVTDNQYGLRFLIPDDTGIMKFYKAELCKFAGTEDQGMKAMPQGMKAI